MQITTSHEGSAVVIGVRGRLASGLAEEALFDAVKHAISGGCQRVIIDMGETGAVDSAGLGALIASQRECSSADVELRLVNVGPRLRSLLKLARMDEFFAISEARGTSHGDADV